MGRKDVLSSQYASLQAIADAAKQRSASSLTVLGDHQETFDERGQVEVTAGEAVLDLELSQRRLDEIREIVENGRALYGRCLRCPSNRQIPLARMEAYPTATLCIQHARAEQSPV